MFSSCVIHQAQIQHVGHISSPEVMGAIGSFMLHGSQFHAKNFDIARSVQCTRAFVGGGGGAQLNA